MSDTPATALDIAIIRKDDGWPAGLEAVAETAIREALRQSQAEVAGPAEISILLTGDAEQQQLNSAWRSIDKSTNVLSFPQVEPFAPVEGMLGDISLARETVEREAVEEGVTFEAHFTHLVVHGFLHILGYDHISDEDALAMESLETQILATLGIADPYADE